MTLERRGDHEYYIDNIRALGVTETLTLVGAREHNAVHTDEGLRRGEDGHDFATEYARCVCDGDGLLPAPRTAREQAFVQFCADYGVEFHVIKKMLASPRLLLAGEPDFVVSVRRHGYPRGRMPLDLKFGAEEDWHPLQLTLYAELDGACQDGHGLCLYLKDTGYLPRFHDLKTLRVTALSMVSTAHWLRAHRKGHR